MTRRPRTMTGIFHEIQANRQEASQTNKPYKEAWHATDSAIIARETYKN